MRRPEWAIQSAMLSSVPSPPSTSTSPTRARACLSATKRAEEAGISAAVAVSNTAVIPGCQARLRPLQGEASRPGDATGDNAHMGDGNSGHWDVIVSEAEVEARGASSLQPSFRAVAKLHLILLDVRLCSASVAANSCEPSLRLTIRIESAG